MNDDSNQQIEENDSESNDKIVIFMLGRERFALPMSCVQEIIRPPKTVKVPLSRSILIGLANLRGSVLPIFDTHSMLGLPSAQLSDSSRALVVNSQNGQSQALLVDRVLAVQDFEDHQVDWDVKGIDTEVESRWLQGLIRQGDEVIMLMDSAYLDHTLSGNQPSRSDARAWQDTDADPDLSETLGDELQLVTMELNQQVYGLPIDHVREIVHCPGKIVEVAGCRSELLGVFTLRERMLPLISLRSLFGMSQPKLEPSHRVVVVELADHTQVGIVIDRMREVLTIHKSDLEPVPVLISEQVKYLEKICRPNQGDHVISLINLGGLFADLAQQALADTAHLDAQTEQATNQEDTLEMDSNDDSQWVLFKLDDEEFGVPITSVKEIVRVPEKLNRIPKAPESLEGVINLRGKVLPVIDQKRRMGLGHSNRTERQRIMVYQMGEIQAGFIVDSVSQVMRIASEHIEPAPASAHDAEGLIVSVAKLDEHNRMVMLIDSTKLLSDQDMQRLPHMVDPSLTEAALSAAPINAQAPNFETSKADNWMGRDNAVSEHV